MSSAAAPLGRLFAEALRRLREAHPWTHLAALFGSHILGAFFIDGFISSRHPGRLAALSALGAGLAVCLWGRKRYPEMQSPPWLRLLPVLCYAFFITAMSHEPLRGVRLPVSGNAFHPIVYACLAVFLGWLMISLLYRRLFVPFGFWVLAPGTLFAISDEWHQSWVPGRCSSALDVFLDVMGLGIGIGVVIFLQRWAPRWNPRSAGPALQDPMTVRVTANKP
ncbi:MAG: VanZ family protein [Desulfosoma sp.]